MTGRCQHVRHSTSGNVFYTTHLHTYITYLLNSQEESSSSNSICTLKVQKFPLLSFGWWTGSCEYYQECIDLLHSLNGTSKHFQFSNQPLFAWIRIVTGIYLKLNYCPQHCLLYGGNGIPKSQSHKENSHFGLVPEAKFIVHACVPFCLFIARSPQHFLRIMLAASVRSELHKLHGIINNSF